MELAKFSPVSGGRRTNVVSTWLCPTWTIFIYASLAVFCLLTEAKKEWQYMCVYNWSCSLSNPQTYEIADNEIAGALQHSSGSFQ